MAVFFIVTVDIADVNARNRYDDYILNVKPIVESHGGRYLVRSEHISLFAGTQKPDRIIVIQFENRLQLDTCFASEEYVSIKGWRETSVKTNALIVEQ